MWNCNANDTVISFHASYTMSEMRAVVAMGYPLFSINYATFQMVYPGQLAYRQVIALLTKTLSQRNSIQARQCEIYHLKSVLIIKRYHSLLSMVNQRT